MLLLAAVLVGFSLLNIVLWLINAWGGLPLFMDSVGTAVAAALLGPLPGAAVALISQLSFEVWDGFNWMFAPWVVCSFATALIVGFAVGARRFSSLFDLGLVIIAVSLANAVLGALVHIYLYGGYAGHATDLLVQSFELLTGGPLLAAFWARIPLNLLDKSIAVSVAYLAYRRWGDRLKLASGLAAGRDEDREE